MKQASPLIFLPFIFGVTLPFYSGASNTPNADLEFAQLSRYVKIKVDTTLQQKNPLKTVVVIKYPPEIKTVGQALIYSLEDSGFVMPNSKGLTDNVKILLSRPLPRIHREFRFVTLENILKTLSGESFSLLVDPISRKINFASLLDY